MQNKILKVRVSSGLGNQLFMFCNAFNLAKKYNFILKIDDKSAFFQKKNQSFKRESKLSNFKILKRCFKQVYCFDTLAKHYLRKILILFNGLFKSYKFIKEHTFSKTKKTFFKPVILNNKQNIELSGYFECEKYFQHSKNDLQKILLVKHIFNSKYINYLKFSNSVSIHIRTNGYYGYAFNNFKKNLKIRVSDQINYIRKAIVYIESRIKNPKFFIWSDDPKTIKKFFNNSKFIIINTNNDIKDFYLFRYCKHFIVSPSSYHWMGAWLNLNKNKICTRPKYMNPSNNVDFWPKSWVII